jgi:predicted transcriptional regulator
MTKPKQLVLEAVHRLPESATFGDIAAEVDFLSAIREGEEDIQQGRIVSNEQVKRRLSALITASTAQAEGTK